MLRQGNAHSRIHQAIAWNLLQLHVRSAIDPEVASLGSNKEQMMV
jgi:hypothetical protein